MKSLTKTISRFLVAVLAIGSFNTAVRAVELDDATRTVALNSTKSIH